MWDGVKIMGNCRASKNNKFLSMWRTAWWYVYVMNVLKEGPIRELPTDHVVG